MYSLLKTSSICTKTTRKFASVPHHALGEEEVGEEEEVEVERMKEEVDEGKTVREGAEPACVLRFGIVVVRGRSQVAVREKTEGGGRGEGRSQGAEGGRRSWQTDAGVIDGVGKIASW